MSKPKKPEIVVKVKNGLVWEVEMPKGSGVILKVVDLDNPDSEPNYYE